MTQEQTQTPEDLFADAERFIQMALRELDAGDIRQASEKAWGATVASANALLLARTGRKPPTTALTRIGIEDAADRDSQLDSIRLRFLSREDTLHGRCFYDGICEPRPTIERRIRETADLIHDAREQTTGR